MKTHIQIYDDIKEVVSFFSKHLRFDKFKNNKGRKLALEIKEIISISLFKHKNGIPTKKAVHELLKPDCSYKTLAVNMNRWYFLAVLILTLIMKINRVDQHPVKHIDSTDIPVCLFKNANAHKTMKGLASFRKSSKGTYYGLKLHLISDLKRRLLKIKFTSANVDDREVVIEMSKELWGILIADAGYIKEKLQREYRQEGKRMMLVQPRKNMKKLATKFELMLYRTRMLIELNFRSLKMFHGLITSLPRSIDGYFANYIYSILAYQIV